MWPENWPAFVLFASVQTQWNVSMGGPTGLRYEALYPLLDRETSDPHEWRSLFQDIQILESAALKQMAENQTEI